MDRQTFRRLHWGGSGSDLSTSISSAVYLWPWGSLDCTARNGWGCDRSFRVKSGPRGKNCRTGPPEPPAMLDLPPEDPDLSWFWAAADLDWDCLSPSALSEQSKPDCDNTHEGRNTRLKHDSIVVKAGDEDLRAGARTCLRPDERAASV